MNKKVRGGLGVILLCFILIMVIYVFINKDEVFSSVIKIKYIDGCEEKFVNNELVSDECEMGRLDRLRKEIRGNSEFPDMIEPWMIEANPNLINT